MIGAAFRNSRSLAAKPESSPITNGGVWCKSRKSGKCDNIINPLQGLSDRPVRAASIKTNASKADHISEIRYIFLNLKKIKTEKKFNFYMIYFLQFISFQDISGKS